MWPEYILCKLDFFHCPLDLATATAGPTRSAGVPVLVSTAHASHLTTYTLKLYSASRTRTRVEAKGLSRRVRAPAAAHVGGTAHRAAARRAAHTQRYSTLRARLRLTLITNTALT